MNSAPSKNSLLNTSLWNRISEFQFDDPASDFSFTDRLIRENAWSLEYGLRAIMEYKRFMYLICTRQSPLTPSDQVDQVWHLHLLYTESYWNDWCKDTLQQEIHHGPTKGGSNEKAKFNDLYSETMAYYKEQFNEEPPEDLWPPSPIRFGEIHFVRVNTHRNWIIPKVRLIRRK